MKIRPDHYVKEVSTASNSVLVWLPWVAADTILLGRKANSILMIYQIKLITCREETQGWELVWLTECWPSARWSKKQETETYTNSKWSSTSWWSSSSHLSSKWVFPSSSNLQKSSAQTDSSAHSKKPAQVVSTHYQMRWKASPIVLTWSVIIKNILSLALKPSFMEGSLAVSTMVRSSKGKAEDTRWYSRKSWWLQALCLRWCQEAQYCSQSECSFSMLDSEVSTMHHSYRFLK